MTSTVAIVYHSGYGHTAKVAEAVAHGAKGTLYNVEKLTDADWDALDKADAIVFGAPTYMGSASAAFKKFAEESSKKWGAGAWKDKLAGGFTNSASYIGDKGNTLHEIFSLASQHGMIWVSLGHLPPQFAAGEAVSIDAVNRLGSFVGVATQANHAESAETAPGKGDLETARIYGERVAKIAARFQ